MLKKLLFILFLFLISKSYSQTHIYQFNGVLTEYGGVGPALTQVTDATCTPAGTNGSFTTGSVTTASGACGSGSQPIFAFNQNGGLSYPNSAGLGITGTYTINIFYKITDYTLGSFQFQKIIDFSNGTSDNGLYTNNNGAAANSPTLDNVFGVASHPILTAPAVTNQYALVTLVRSGGSGGTLSVYLNGASVLTYTDVADDYLSSGTNPIIFFRDDVSAAFPCESGPGAVRYISISNAASTSGQVATTWSTLCNTLLPINLSSFIAQKNNLDAILQWQTNNETNTAYFDVERSFDGQTFTVVGKVNAKNSSVNTYTYNDNAAFAIAGNNAYYRLKTVDINGKFKYSAIVKLTNTKGGKISLFPNPTTDAVTISGLNTKDVIRLLSIDGKVLLQQKAAANSMILNIEKYKSGSYIIQVKNDTEVIQQKFVKQ